MSGLALRATDAGVDIKVRVVPGARRERIVGVHGDALKVAVQAPPERGKANERLLHLLAAALGIPARQLEVIAGAASRDKIVRVRGLSSAAVAAALVGG